MNPHHSRVVAVFGARQGSGYLLGPRILLTAAHVVGKAESAEAVVFGGVGVVACDVVWRRKDDACDAALLVARTDIAPAEVTSAFTPLRWGKLIGLDAQENCQAIGFPRVQRDEQGNVDSEQISGRVKPGSSILRGRYVLEASGAPPQPTTSQSPWSGLSGAGLFCGGALIGVIVTAPAGWNNGRVEAVPMHVIADDQAFRKALREHGGIDAVVEALDELSDLEREGLEFEVRYRQYVARRYGQVETLGHGSESSLGRIVWPLDTAFLALELAETATHRTPLEVASGHRVQTALHGRSKVLVQGGAGSGKTTLMHWLAVRAALHDLPVELNQWQDRVPFVVPLRTLAGSQGIPQAERLLDALRYPAAEGKPDGWLTRLLDRGRVLLLVDGIDEVQYDQRPQVRSWLEGLLSLYPDTAVVVTSRPSAVSVDWLAGYGFDAFSVLPMSLADIDAFITRWFSALREDVSWSGLWSFAERCCEELRSEVSRNLSLAQMAASPRLCTLICTLFLDRRGFLPGNPTALHRAAVDLLLSERDMQRGFAFTEGVRLNSAQQMHLLGAFALWMTFNGTEQLTQSRAQRIIEECLIEIRTPRLDADPLNPKWVLRHLLVRSGVLRHLPPEIITFEHSTFRDFFAARALWDGGHLGFLINHAHDPQYEDVVRLAVGESAGLQAGELLLGLVERGDREPVHRVRIHLLAVTALAYAHRVAPEVREEVLRRAGALIPPGDDAAADLLAEAGEAVLNLLPGPDGLSLDETRAVVLTACKIGGPRASDFLARFEDHADPAVRERARWGRSRLGWPQSDSAPLDD